MLSLTLVWLGLSQDKLSTMKPLCTTSMHISRRDGFGFSLWGQSSMISISVVLVDVSFSDQLCMTTIVGIFVVILGRDVGDVVGIFVAIMGVDVREMVGADVEEAVGIFVGVDVEESVGIFVGKDVWEAVGIDVGDVVGIFVSIDVGEMVVIFVGIGVGEVVLIDDGLDDKPMLVNSYCVIYAFKGEKKLSDA